jgi:pimeloyl-ACP methyl ester carboxylesterase
MTRLKLMSSCSFLLLILTACGGGGGETSDTPAKTTPSVIYSSYTITAIDGYLENATAWLDVQHSGEYKSSNPTTTTSIKGNASLSIPNTIVATDYPVIVEAKQSITFDAGLNRLITNNFTLAAPAGERYVTPFSTLVYLKMKSGITQATAITEVARQLQVSGSGLLTDFIERKDERMTLIAADLVRLNIFPATPQQMVSVAINPQNMSAELTRYASIQGDVNDFKGVVRNSVNLIELDTDVDGIADSDDPDIDGDSIPNEQDTHPYEFDRHTAQSPSELVLALAEEETLLAGQWHYFKLTTPEDILLNVNLSQLTGDLDLYIKQGAVPTKFDYDCRSNNSYQNAEKCLQRLKQGQIHYIAVAAKEDSNYRLEAILDEIIVSKVSLLLHGLASDTSTWDAVVNDDSFFSGSCATLNPNDELVTLPQVNRNGESCFRLNFGAYDRDPHLSSKGLDGKTCIVSANCKGDYTSFELLGKEIETAIGQIITKLGIDTEIILLGHSRGGLAARAYLQNSNSQYQSYIKALVTTGTPHQGSPLGRFYRYMDENCTPQRAHENDNGKCEDNWEVIKMMAGERWYFTENLMDLRVPSIDFLSPESSEIINLNANVLALENVVTAQLSYHGTQFGILAENIGLGGDYDLYAYQQFLGGDHPHPSTLRYIEQGQSRASFIGDGIVPVYSQQLSELLIPYGRNVDLAFSSNSSNVIHTEQTSRVSELHSMFESVRTQIAWKE